MRMNVLRTKSFKAVSYTHLDVYKRQVQPDEYEEGKPILRFKCSGPMMNAHFEPHSPQCIPPHTSTVVNRPICTSLGTESLEKIVVEQTAQDQSEGDIPLIYLLNSAKRDIQNHCVTPPADLISKRKNRRSRVNDRIKRHKNRESVRKYNSKNPEVHREAVKRYNKANPDVNRGSVFRYSKKHPEVNQEAVRRYTENRQLIPWKTKSLSGFKYDRSTDYNNDKGCFSWSPH